MRFARFVVALFLGAGTALAAADQKTEMAEKKAAATSAAADAGFQRLTALAGDWVGSVDGKPSAVSYKVVSNGTAVMETMNGGEHSEMVTMYHPDGASLLMTHYCAIGNQPRMRAKGLVDGALEFRYVDASNLSAPDAPRMSRLVMSFPDADHLVHVWTYKEGDKEQSSRFEFARKK